MPNEFGFADVTVVVCVFHDFHIGGTRQAGVDFCVVADFGTGVLRDIAQSGAGHKVGAIGRRGEAGEHGFGRHLIGAQGDGLGVVARAFHDQGVACFGITRQGHFDVDLAAAGRQFGGAEYVVAAVRF